MTSISQNIRYLPHTLETRYHAVKTYQNGASVDVTKFQKPLSCAGTSVLMAQKSR